VIRVTVCPVSNHFGVNLGAAFDGLLPFLQNQNTGSFSNDESISIPVERTAGPLRFIVARGQRLHSRKTADSERSNRRLGSAGDYCVLQTAANQVKCFTDGMGSGGACRRGRPIDSFRAVANGNLPGRQV